MRALSDPSRGSPLRRLATLGLVFVAAILSCGKDVTGPLSSAARYVRGLAFNPVFPPLFQAAGGASSGLVDFSKVHVVLHHSDGTVALDTTIDFPAGADSLTVDLTVKLLDGAPTSGEPMTLNLGYVNAAGDTVFRGGPVSLTAAPPAVPGQPNPPVKVPVAYTGPGASAAAVVISPRSLTVSGGGTFSFSAVAQDASGNALPGTPIIWNTLDPSLATVTSPAAGSGVVGNTRGVARIQAQLLTGQTDQVTITIVLPASQLLSQGGNAQTATVGTTLPQPLVVKVAASDGVGVAGTTVNFAVASGGGSLTNASAVSDANGLAQTSWKLGTSTGPQSVTASAAGLSGSPVTFTAAAQAANATKLLVTTQPANAAAGATLAPVVFTAEDDNGNVATGFTGAVTVAFAANGAGGTLLGTATVNAVAGVATFSGLSIAKAGSAYTLVASATGIASATTNPFDIVPGAPAKLVFTSQPAGGTANLVFSPTITVTAQDAFGNVTPAFTGAVTLAFAANPSSANLLGTATQSAVAGVATFPGIGISLGGNGYQLTASATGLTSATTAPFNISGGVATNISVSSGGGQTGVVGAALALPVVVKVADVGGVGVAGTTVNFAVATGGGSLSAASGVSDGAGLVSITWTLGATIGAQSITATASGLTGSPLTIGATGTAVVPTMVKFTTQPSNAAAGASITPAIVVTATDAANHTATTYTGNVTLSIGTNPGTSTLGGTVTVAAVAGVATFSNITLNHAGTGYTLGAASGTLTAAVSNTFNIASGTAANIAVSAGQAQSGGVSTVLPTALAVLVTDANANPVSGTTVNWAVATGGGSVSGANSVTNAAGIATITWTLGATPGAQSVTATSAGLSGSPITFTANAAVVSLANKTWTGATSTDFGVATNWLPVGVPAAGDSVLIPPTANNPVVHAQTTIASLYVNSGATLTLLSGGGNLVANGAADLTGGVLGTGSLTVSSPVPRTLKGNFAGGGTLNVLGTYTLNGALVVTGNLTSQTGGSLILNGNSVTQTGNFSTLGTGTLNMTNAADALTVTGSVTFSGGSEAGLLTAGVLSVTGNFTQSTTATSFVATATHQTAFVGSVAQTISFANPGTSTFGKLTSGNAAGVTLATGVATAGDVILGGPMTGSLGLTIGGSLFDVGTKLAVPSISFIGSGAPVGSTTNTINANVTFNNSPSILQANLIVNGAVNVNLGNLQLNGHQLVVNGSFVTQNGAQLTMTNPADSLYVSGNATFGGGVEAGILTAGKLVLNGNFTQTNAGSGQEFKAVAGHQTILTGSAAQTISFASPDTIASTCSLSCFGDLFVTKSGGTVDFQSSAGANGSVNIAAGVTAVTAIGASGSPKFLLVRGTTTTAAGTGVHATRFGSFGTLALDASSQADTVQFHGTAAQTIPSNDYYEVVIKGTPTVGAGGFTAGANLTVDGGQLTLGGHSVYVAGGFLTTGTGVLVMNNALDSLLVMKQATFSGGAEAGKLTNGALVLFQGIVATAPGMFSASGSHVTTLVGPVLGCNCANRIPGNPGMINPTLTRSGTRAPAMTKAGLAARRAAGAAAIKDVRAKVAAAAAARRALASKFMSRAEAVRLAAAAARLGRGAAAPGQSGGPARQPSLAGRPDARLMIPGAPRIGGRTGDAGIGTRSATVIPVHSYSDTAVYVTFVDTTGNQFANVRVIGSAQWQTFTRTSGDVQVDTTGDIEGTGRLSIGGNLYGSSTSTVEPEAVELFGVLSDTGYFSPDTTLFSGAAQTMPSNVNGGGQLNYNNVVVNSPALAVLADDNTIYVNSSLLIQNSGQLRLGVLDAGGCGSGCPFDLYVYGALETHQNGTLRMNDVTGCCSNVTVYGNAMFAGGSTTGLLNQNEIDFYGNFLQAGATLTSFAADSGHLSYFGTLGDTVQFSNPGKALSHFGDVYFGSAQIILRSSIVANGSLQTGNTTSHQILGSSAGFSVTSSGADIRHATFDGVTWTLLDGSPVTDMDSVIFANQTPTVTQFTVQRSGLLPLTDLTNWSFLTTPTGAGRYVNAFDTDGPANGALTLNFVNTTPSSSSGLVTLGGVGGLAVITGWSSAVSVNWLGTTSTDWNVAANWSGGSVPGINTDVVIPSGTPNSPQTSVAANTHNLTVNTGASLSLLGAQLIVNGDLAVQAGGQVAIPSSFGLLVFGNVVTDTVGTTGVTGCVNGSGLNLQAGTHTITGKFCNLFNSGTYTASGPIVVVGAVSNAGQYLVNAGANLTLAGHRMDVGSYSSSGGTGGTITMHNSADTLVIHGGGPGFSQFAGASQTGLIDAGTIIDRAPTFIATGTGFDASGTNKFVTDSGAFQSLTWNTPVAGHGFNDLTLMNSGSFSLPGTFWVNGTLLFDATMTAQNTQTFTVTTNNYVDNTSIVGGALSGSASIHIKGTSGAGLPTTLNVNNLHLDGGGNLSLTKNLTTNYVVVDSGSGLILNGHTLKTQGNSLTTQNGGVIGMTAAADSIDLGGGTAYFNGGQSQFTNGGFAFASLFQGYDGAALVPSAAANSFSPTAGLRAHMSTGTGTTIYFANPGTGPSLSHFWYLQASTSSTATLRTNMFVDSILVGEFSGSNLSSDSTAQNKVRTVTTQSIYNAGTFGMSLSGVAIKLVDGQPFGFFNSITFGSGYAGFTGNVFEVARTSAGSYSFTGLNFTSVVTSGLGVGGEYVNNTGTQPLSFTGVTGITLTSLTGGQKIP